jgi:hypothetical protein
VVPALALAVALMLKPLLWPLAIWLAATRRWRAAGLTALVTGAGMTAGYAALHVNGLRSYPSLVRATTTIEGRGSYSVYGLLSRLGLPAPLAVAYVVGAALLVATCYVARRDERLSFVAAIGATLALTPIMWVHYFSLLLIPLAFGSRRLSWWWAPLVVMWLVNAKPADASPASITVVWWLVLLTLAALIAQRPRAVTPATSG